MPVDYDDFFGESLVLEALKYLHQPCDWKDIYYKSQEISGLSIDPYEFIQTLSASPMIRQTTDGKYRASENLFTQKNKPVNTSNRKGQNKSKKYEKKQQNKQSDDDIFFLPLG